MALVVLAAGASTRLGMPKALVRLRPGEQGSALALLLAAGRELGDPRPLLVTGRHHAEIAAAAPPWVEVLENPDWSAGRTGSVRHALARRGGCDLCLAPIDVPLVPGAVFAALAREWVGRGAPPRGWLAPYFQRPDGARAFGHPILMGHELAADLKDFPPERSLRALRARATPLLALPVTSAAILDDLDEPADQARLSGPDGPPGDGDGARFSPGASSP